MPDFAHLLSAALQSELAASRRRAQRTGCSEEHALRETLAAKASPRSVAELLAERAARAGRREAKRAAAQQRRQSRHDGPPTPWRAWFDGSAHPNPGNCGIGALLTGPSGERIEISRAAGHGNSGEAEYRALIALLEAAVANGAHGLTIYGDSQVVVNDVTGVAGAAALHECRKIALALIAQLRGVTLRWIPRHRNAAADALSQRAIRTHSPRHETDLDDN